MRVSTTLILSLLLISCQTANLFELDSKIDDQQEVFDVLTSDYIPTLGPDDKISISVWNHDDLSVGSAFSIYNTNESFGKWVLIEKDSTVKIPQIGSMKLGGLTPHEAEDSIAKVMSLTVKNPIVEIKILNAEVTILGEVLKPGKYPIERELNTLVELIGAAQGLTSYAKKSQIQVIRNNVSYKVDLTKMNQLSANNLYIQSKDIIYVPAVRSKKLHERAPTLIPFATMLTSAGVLISVLSK